MIEEYGHENSERVTIDGEEFIRKGPVGGAWNFFRKHWLDAVNSPLQRSLFAFVIPKEWVKDLDSIDVLLNAKEDIVAIGLRQESDAREHRFGAIVVDPDYRRRGLGQYLLSKQHERIKPQDPEQMVISVIASTVDGLKTMLNVKEKKLFPEEIDIRVAYSAAEEVFNWISFQMNEMDECIWSAFEEGRLQFDIGEDTRRLICESFDTDSLKELKFEEIFTTLLRLSFEPKELTALLDADTDETISLLAKKGVRLTKASHPR